MFFHVVFFLRSFFLNSKKKERFKVLGRKEEKKGAPWEQSAKKPDGMENKASKWECKECKKVFTKNKKYLVHMKSMQHAYRIDFLEGRKQEKEEYFRTESEERGRKAALVKRALPIVERFHAKMYKLMKETDQPTKQSNQNEKEKEKEKGNDEGEKEKVTEEGSKNENGEEKEKDWKEDSQLNDRWAVLTKSINDHYSGSRPRELIRKRRRCLFALVKEITAEFYPDAKLEVYGSIPLALDAENSDIDVSVMLKEGGGGWGGASGHDQAVHMLNEIGDAIDFCGSTHLRITKVMLARLLFKSLQITTSVSCQILTARIPLITISDEGLSGLQLDLSLWMMDKLEINRVLVAYLSMDDRIRPLMKAVRVWSKVC